MRRTGFAAVAFLAAMITSLAPAQACCHVGFTATQYSRVSAVFTQDGYRITIQKDIITREDVPVLGGGPRGVRIWEPASLSIREPDGSTYSGAPAVYLVPLTLALAEGPVATTRGPVAVSLYLHRTINGLALSGAATGSATFTLPDGTMIGPLAPESASFTTDV